MVQSCDYSYGALKKFIAECFEMESLRKSLREYFRHLEKHNIDIIRLIKNTSKSIDGLKNLSDQHRLVSKAEVESLPIGRVPGIKENLLFKIESAIDEEIVELQKIIKDCKTKNILLKNKLQSVKQCLGNAGDLTTIEDRKPLCYGTASCPSVLGMVEWAEDSWRFYHALYLKFSNIIMVIQSEDDRRITELSKYYLHSEERKLFLERVFSMTKKFIDDA